MNAIGNHPRPTRFSPRPDCIQSTDYLYTKPDLILNLRMFASMEKRNLKAIFPRHIGSVPPHSYALISTMLAILAGSSIISFL